MLCMRSLSLSLLSSRRTFLSLPLDFLFRRLPDLVGPLPFRPWPSDPVHVSSLICTHIHTIISIVKNGEFLIENGVVFGKKKNPTHRRRIGKLELPLTARRPRGLAARQPRRHYAVATEVRLANVIPWIRTHVYYDCEVHENMKTKGSEKNIESIPGELCGEMRVRCPQDQALVSTKALKATLGKKFDCR